jgi:maleylacetate reductase
VILPHAVAFNARALPEEMRRLADAMGVPGGDPAAALWDLAKTSDIPTDLASLGLPREGLEEVAAEVVVEEKNNPVPLDEASVMALLNAAYDGIRPSATASV